MKVLIDNILCKIIVGGTDNLQAPGILQELSDYMSVDVPGAFFTSAYKKRHWDGKRRFITPKGHKMATGFLPLLLKYIEEEHPGLSVELVDNRGELPQFRDDFLTTVGDVQITEEYEHQIRMIQAFDNILHYSFGDLYFPRGIMNAATNAGKTAAIGGVYLNLLGDNKMIVLIHRKTIFEQLVKYFSTIGEVGTIDAKNYNVQTITIGMIKTVFNRLESPNVQKDLSQFNVVACDEAHLSGSKTYSKVLQHIPAPVRVFVSGTPFDSDAIINKMIAIGLSGPEVVKVSKRELMDKGISANVVVHIHLCRTKPKKALVSYKDSIDELIYYSMDRVVEMHDIIKSTDRSTLIAIEQIEHGKFIFEKLKLLSMMDQNELTVEFVHGTDSKREEKIEQFKSGSIKVLISTEILKEGVNIPIIGNTIYAVGGKSGVDIKQWMGRGERKSDIEEVTFHDFYDIGKYVATQSRKRIRLYRAEDLQVIEHYDREDIRKKSKESLEN